MNPFGSPKFNPADDVLEDWEKELLSEDPWVSALRADRLPPDRSRQEGRVSFVLKMVTSDQKSLNTALNQAELGRLIQGLLRLAEGTPQ